MLLFDAINFACVKEEKKVDGKTEIDKHGNPVKVCKSPTVCTSNEYGTAKKWVTDRINADVQSLSGKPENQTVAELQTNGTRFRGYTSVSLTATHSCSYGFWYNKLKIDIETTIKNLKEEPDAALRPYAPTDTRSERRRCDMKLIVDASRVCNNSTENEEVKNRCRKAVEKANYFLVRHGFGEESFEERQRQYCHCCPPPAHKDKKRQMIANTENVRLVKDPKYWANDDFLIARLPKGTTVEVLDKGAGEPFNQTALEYQWWWVRAEGKEGWVMQVLLDDVTGSP